MIPDVGSIVGLIDKRGSWKVYGTHGQGEKLSVEVRQLIGADEYDSRSHWVRPSKIKDEPASRRRQRWRTK